MVTESVLFCEYFFGRLTVRFWVVRCAFLFESVAIEGVDAPLVGFESFEHIELRNCFLIHSVLEVLVVDAFALHWVSSLKIIIKTIYFLWIYTSKNASLFSLIK